MFITVFHGALYAAIHIVEDYLEMNEFSMPSFQSIRNHLILLSVIIQQAIKPFLKYVESFIRDDLDLPTYLPTKINKRNLTQLWYRGYRILVI